MIATSFFRLLIFFSLYILTTTAQGTGTTVTYTDTPVTITTTPSSTPPSPQYTDTTALQSAVLNSTNTYRKQHNASSITWNDTLASYASSKVKSCKFAHTNGPYGENLAQGYENMTAAIDGWGGERKDYDFKEANFEEETGHFTQLVWQDMSSTGCGVQDCKKDGWLVFCEYWPRGNIIGKFQENVLSQVSNDHADEGVSTSANPTSRLPKGYNSAPGRMSAFSSGICLAMFGLVTGAFLL